MAHRLDPDALRAACRAALAEDIGSGDATTDSIVPPDLQADAVIASREPCVCAGLPVVHAVFSELDPGVVVEPLVDEGAFCPGPTDLVVIHGTARALLTGERTALNFMQRLSGIATLTRKYVEAARPFGAEILDTRKTTPGLRMLEKYAVSVGGGTNHRMGLYDRILIKDNHLLLAGIEGPDAVARAVQACRERHPDLEIEVEADSTDVVQAAIEAGADIIMLDNMTIEEMQEAVRLIAGRALVEASGGITLDMVPAVAASGVDWISVGALTHSARAVDLSMRIEMLSGEES